MRGFLLQTGIHWSFNPPAASHMGGIWERMIRSVRRVFNSVIRNVLLDDSELSTVMCEVECVINNRPITPKHSRLSSKQIYIRQKLLRQRDTEVLSYCGGARLIIQRKLKDVLRLKHKDFK